MGRGQEHHRHQRRPADRPLPRRNNTTAAAIAGRANVFFTFDAANVDRSTTPRPATAATAAATPLRGPARRRRPRLQRRRHLRDRHARHHRPRGIGQTTPTTFTKLPSTAAYKHEVGVVRVDAADGRIGTVKPGDVGYLQAALTSATRQVIFSDTTMPGVDTRTLSLSRASSTPFYMITQGTAEDVLARNRATRSAAALAYFSNSEANPTASSTSTGTTRASSAWRTCRAGRSGLQRRGDPLPASAPRRARRSRRPRPDAHPTPTGDTTPPTATFA